MKTELRKNAKNDFEKDLFKLMNNIVFAKTIENMRKDRDVKLLATKARKSCLVSELNYHTTTFYSENLLVIEMKKNPKNIHE